MSGTNFGGLIEMSHLAKFRVGWSYENLAQFILYNFVFTSTPLKIADDIGIDFICTLILFPGHCITEGVEKVRFSRYFCGFFIKNHHIWQQNEGFF